MTRNSDKAHGEERAAADDGFLREELSFLRDADPAPQMSDELLMRVLGDAAALAPEIAPVAAPVASVTDAPRQGLWDALSTIWRPASAAAVAAALGLWLGWADPVGVGVYAEAFLMTETAALESAEADTASLYEMEL